MVIGKHKINGGLAVQLLKAFKNSMQCRIFSTGYLGSKKASETPSASYGPAQRRALTAHGSKAAVQGSQVTVLLCDLSLPVTAPQCSAKVSPAALPRTRQKERGHSNTGPSFPSAPTPPQV